jgi:hypothetical protein
MMMTGDWTVPELVKYLTSVQGMLTEEEIKRLAATPAFVAEEPKVDAKSWAHRIRYKAADLYEPVPIFKELGLPVLDWGEQVKWKPGNEEGASDRPGDDRILTSLPLAKFLHKLGLKRFPPTKVIVGLAASSDITVRAKALSYLLENFDRHYATNFNINQFADIAFVPTRQSGAAHLSKPKEVRVPKVTCITI